MNNRKREEIYANTISWRSEIKKSKVKKLRNMSLDKAVGKFLSEKDIHEIYERDLYIPVENLKGEHAEFYAYARDILPPKQLEFYFNKTKEGEEWYKSNHPKGVVMGEIMKRLHPLPNKVNNKRMTI
jgi:hypothetical protein